MWIGGQLLLGQQYSQPNSAIHHRESSTPQIDTVGLLHHYLSLLNITTDVACAGLKRAMSANTTQSIVYLIVAQIVQFILMSESTDFHFL